MKRIKREQTKRMIAVLMSFLMVFSYLPLDLAIAADGAEAGDAGKGSGYETINENEGTSSEEAKAGGAENASGAKAEESQEEAKTKDGSTEDTSGKDAASGDAKEKASEGKDGSAGGADGAAKDAGKSGDDAEAGKASKEASHDLPEDVVFKNGRAKATRKYSIQATSTKPEFDLIWTTGTAKTTISSNQHDATLAPASDAPNNKDNYVSAQVSLSIGYTDKPVKAGDIKMELPYKIWKDHNGSLTGATIVGVTKKPNHNDTFFWYYLADDNGNEVSSESQATKIVITNYDAVSVPSGERTDFTCMVNYGFMPSEVKDNERITVKGNFTVKGQDVTVNNDTLTVKADTSSKLESAEKRVVYKPSDNTSMQYETWDDSWGTKPSNADNYRFVVYSIRAKVKGSTQPYTLSLSESPGNGGRLFAYREHFSRYSSSLAPAAGVRDTHDYSSYGGSWVLADSTHKGPISDPRTSTFDGSSYNTNHLTSSGYNEEQYYYTTVVVGYPKSQSNAGTQVTNNCTVTLTDLDNPNNKQNKQDDTKYTMRDLSFNYTGDLFKIDKVSWNVTENAKFFLKQGMEAEMDPYYLYVKARGYGLTQRNVRYDANGRIILSSNRSDYGHRDYRIEVIDDQLYLEGQLLNDNDYYIKTVTFYNHAEFNWGGNGQEPKDTEDKSPARIWYRYSNSGAWVDSGVEIGPNSNSGSNSYTFPSEGEGSKPTQVKMVIEGRSYNYEPRFTVTPVIKPTAHVRQIINGAPVPELYNVAALRVLDYKGHWVNFDTYNNVTSTDGLKDKVRAQDLAAGYSELTSNKYIQHDADYQNMTDATVREQYTKKELSNLNEDNDDTHVSKRTYELEAVQDMSFSTSDKDLLLEKMADAGIDYGQREVTFYDLIPEGMEVDQTNIKANYYEAYITHSSSTKEIISTSRNTSSEVPANIDSVEIIHNYKNTNRDMLVVKVSFNEEAAKQVKEDWGKRYSGSDLDLSTACVLTVPTAYSWDNALLYGRETDNLSAAIIRGSNEGCNDDVTGGGNDSIPSNMRNVFRDLDGDGNPKGNDKNTFYANAESKFNIATASRTGYSKSVKSSIEDSYRTNSTEVASGEYGYMLRYCVEKGSYAKNVTIYDVLEADHGDKEHWKGTFKEVNVGQPEKLSIAPVVWYSTKAPDELQEETPDGTKLRNTTLSEANGWVKTTAAGINGLSDAEKADITAIAFDFSKGTDGKDFELDGSNQAKNTVQAYIYMTAPDKETVIANDYLKKKTRAYNTSFLGISTRSTAGSWSRFNAKLGNPTTIRIGDPTPELDKSVTNDAGDTAPGGDAEDPTDTVSLQARNEIFNYEINTVVPTHGYDAAGEEEHLSFTVVDELVNVLRFAEKDKTYVRVGLEDDPLLEIKYESGKWITKYKYREYDAAEEAYATEWKEETLEGTATEPQLPQGVTLTQARVQGKDVLTFKISNNVEDGRSERYDFSDWYAGEEVYISFNAKIRDGAALGDYYDTESKKIKVPNQATYKIPNKPDQTSNTVKVTPPDDPPEDPDKKVGPVGNSTKITHLLGAVEDEYEYTISAEIAGDAGTVELYDELEEVLELVDVDNAKVIFEGQPVINGTLHPETLKREMTWSQVKGLSYTYGITASATTGSDVNNTLSLKMTSDFLNEYGDLVVGQDYDLGDNPTFPQDDRSFSLAGFKFSIVFKAKVKKDADLTPYAVEDGTEIPNVAKYKIENQGEKRSKPVVVIPPEEEIYKRVNNKITEELGAKDEIFKYTINTQIPTHEGHADQDEIESLTVSDTLESVLEFVNKESAKVEILERGDDGKYKVVTDPSGDPVSVGDVTFNDAQRKLNFTLERMGCVEHAGRRLRITFYAKIKDGANLDPYKEESASQGKPGYVPNKASYKIDNKPEVDSNWVWVTPPTIGKTVNDQPEIELENLDEVFTYKVTAVIPPHPSDEEMTRFVVTDELEPVLEFVNEDETTVTIDGTPLSDADVKKQLTRDGQILTFELTKAQIDAHAGKDHDIVISFKAKIKEGADVSGYMVPTLNSGSIGIPNRAKYKVYAEDRMKSEKESKPVTVVPPPISKLVNEKSHETLGTSDEIFNYTISTMIPKKGKLVTDPDTGQQDYEVVSAFNVTDELEEVLEFANKDKVKVKIGDTELTPEQIEKYLKLETDDQTGLSTLIFDVDAGAGDPNTGFEDPDAYALLKGNAGKKLFISFYAKVKDGADLRDYIVTPSETDPEPEGEGEIRIPNDAWYRINNDPDQEQKSKTVTVTPPPIGKTVNDKDIHRLSNMAEIFHYKVSAVIPDTDEHGNPITKLVIRDTLKEVLEFANQDAVKVKIGATELSAEEIAKFLVMDDDPDTGTGRLTFTLDSSDEETGEAAEPYLTDFAGRSIVITFDAKLKDDVTFDQLEEYIEEAEPEVPNTAKLKINDDPEKEATAKVIPPPISKSVNGKTHEDLNAVSEQFTYAIKTAIPKDAKTFVVKDTLEKVLRFASTKTNSVKVMIDGETMSMASRVKFSGQTVTFTLNQNDIKTHGGKTLDLSFDAEIKPGADISGYLVEATEEDPDPEGEGTIRIPNKARYKIDNDPEVETEPVTVTPPPVGKLVDGKREITVKNIDQTFTYTMDAIVPTGSEEEEITGMTLKDTLKDVLEFADQNVTVKLGGRILNENQYTAEFSGKTITVKVSDKALLAANAGKFLSADFNAKIIPGMDYSEYLTEDSEAPEIPNTASLIIEVNNEPQEEIESEPVTVTPPPIEKFVNSKKHEDLDAASQTFTYRVDTTVPAKKDVTEFIVRDTIKDVLEFSAPEEALIQVNGEEVSDLAAEIDGQTITLRLDQEMLDKYKGKTLSLIFDAKIKAGADLRPYEDNETGDILIPNTASYKIDDEDEVESDEVTVTPPPVGKTVNDKNNYELAGADEVFTYHVTAYIPEDTGSNKGSGDDITPSKLTKLVITDTIEPVLEFVDTDAIKVTIGDKELTQDEVKAQLKIEDKTLTFTATEDQVNRYAGMNVVIEFDAKVIDGADLSDYIVVRPEIPNTAAVEFNDDPTTRKETKPVTVTPPPVEKRVNDDFHYDTKTRTEEFEYKVKVYVPNNGKDDEELTKFEVTDTIVDELKFSDAKPVVTLEDGKEAADLTSLVTRSGKTISLVVPAGETLNKYKGKRIILVFKASILPGVDLSKYVDDEDGRVKVPNTAKYIINDDPDQSYESKPVTVTPPPVDKKVNDKQHYDLKGLREVFNYTVDVDVPLIVGEDELKKLEVTDKLVDELEFDGDPKVLLAGKVDADLTKLVKTSGQTLTLTVSDAALIEKIAGKKITISFDAKIKDGADVSKYVDDEDGKVKVPNTAKLVLNDDPDHTYETEPVTVTPPPIDKQVNGKAHEDLKGRNEVFTYTINSRVPKVDNNKKELTKFEIVDTLVNELEFADGEKPKVMLAGKEHAALTAAVKTEGQKLSLTLEKGALLDECKGKLITIEFKASIKEGADVSKYIDKETGKVKIPNTATLIMNDDPDQTYETKPVTVTPPPIEKLVEGKEHFDLDKRSQKFTYEISAQIPLVDGKGDELKSFEIEDTIVDELEFSGKPSVAVDGAKAADIAALIKVSGKTLTLKVDSAEAIDKVKGKTLTITFKAKIAKGVSLRKYLDKEDGEIKVPNTASITFNDDPSQKYKTSPVTVTPPEPAKPGIGKKVNDSSKHSAMDKRGEKIKYTITTKIPYDAKSFVVKDKLVKELEFAGNGSVTVKVGGKKSKVTDKKIKSSGKSAETLSAVATIKGQLLKVSFGRAVLKNSCGETAEITFTAKIRKDADLTKYIKDGKVKVPNTASYVIDNDNETSEDSNTVTAGPRKDEAKPVPEKTDKDRKHGWTPVKTGDAIDLMLWIMTLVICLMAVYVIRKRYGEKL